MKRMIVAAAALAAAIMILVPSSDSDGDTYQTKVSGTLPFAAEAVFSSGGEEVCAVTICDRIMSADLEQGDYILSVRDAEGRVYYQKEISAEDGKTCRFFATTVSAGNSGWKYGTDYTEDIILNGGKASFEPVSVSESGVKIIADRGDSADIVYIPTKERSAGGFCPVYRALTLSTVKSAYKYVLPAAYEFSLTVPSGSSVSMGMEASGKDVPLVIEPISCEDSGDTAALSYRLIPGYTYGFRVSLEGCADVCCVMIMKKGMKTEITREEMESIAPDASDSSCPSEILLNVNAEGFLRMQKGEAFDISPQRNTYTDDDAKYGIFLRPAFVFRAITPDGSISGAVEFEGNRMTAAEDGTAFVLVTCEAVCAKYLNVPGMEDRLLSATAPECTGVFAVTVGEGAGPDFGTAQSRKDSADRICGGHFDSDLDIVYFSDVYKVGLLYINKKYAGQSYQYSPVYENGKLVSFVKSPTGSGENWCRAAIYEGPNIVSVEDGGEVSFQVARGMRIHIYATNLDSGVVSSFIPGDRVVFTAGGIRVPASAQPYGAEPVLTMDFCGETYVCGPDGNFETVVIPDSLEQGETIEVSFGVSASGRCPAFGSHRIPAEDRETEERNAEFGVFRQRSFTVAEFFTVCLDSMAESDWDSYAEADAGIQGKTVDIGRFEAAAGQKLYLTLNRTSQQALFGAKSISGAEGWMRCDIDGSTADRVLMVAEPGEEDIGEHRFTVVLKLLNNQGTMKTTVTGVIRVLESFREISETCIAGKSLALPGIREGTPIEEGFEFSCWNTEPDGTGTDYRAGQMMAPSSDMRLYAQYKEIGVGSTFISDGLYYTITSADGDSRAAEVSGCTGTYGGNLVIPGAVEYGGYSYSVEGIVGKAFDGNKNITAADLSAVGTIRMKAFTYCSNLQTLKIRGNVGPYAFFGCSGLKTVEFTGDTVLYTSAFSGCRNLSDITFPENITIGKNAFHGTRFLSPDGETMDALQLAGYRFTGEGNSLTLYISGTDEEFAFGGLKYRIISRTEAELTGYESEAPENLAVPESVRYLGFDYSVVKIGTKAFYGCSALISADLGCVKTIGLKAFAKCGSLADVSLKEVATIAGYAFYSCQSLESLEFGDGVSIGTSAFYKCLGLKSVSFGNIASIESNSFYGCLFWDPEAGKRIPVAADSLSGMSFAGKATKLIPL